MGAVSEGGRVGVAGCLGGRIVNVERIGRSWVVVGRLDRAGGRVGVVREGGRGWDSGVWDRYGRCGVECNPIRS